MPKIMSGKGLFPKHLGRLAWQIKLIPLFLSKYGVFLNIAKQMLHQFFMRSYVYYLSMLFLSCSRKLLKNAAFIRKLFHLKSWPKILGHKLKLFIPHACKHPQALATHKHAAIFVVKFEFEFLS